MAKRLPADATSSCVDEDGIRELRRDPTGGAQRRILAAAAAVLVLGATLGWWLHEAPWTPSRGGAAVADPGAEPAAADRSRSVSWSAGAGPVIAARSPQRQVAPAPDVEPDEAMPAPDPNDIASYFRPGDEEPTAGELIAALREAGIHEGIAAFNPPGTSPPMEGLAVPDDFELPLGYVRHHQVTDEGEPIEPILMFSPDFEFVDAEGRLIELPVDRVVPEELAPAGLPIRRVRIPSP